MERVGRIIAVVAALSAFGLLRFAPAAAAQPTVYAVHLFGNKVQPIVGLSTHGEAIQVGEEPAGIALTPDGKRAYVANTSSSSVSLVDTATNGVIKTIAVGNGPSGVAVTPDGSHVYVTNGDDDTVSVIDTNSNAVVRTIEIEYSAAPVAVAITPDGRTAYVANFLHGSVSVIDTATGNVKDIIDVADNPTALAVTPDGRSVYVTSMHWSVLPDQDDGTVSVIDTASGAVVKELKVDLDAVGIAIAPDGRTAYVTNIGSDDITVIDTQTNTITGTITSTGGPAAIAITADGRTAYVNNMRAGSVSVLDLQASPPAKKTEIPIGSGGTPDVEFARIAITPNQPPNAELSAPQSAYAGVPVSFDASASSDDGVIESYSFEFGDGHSATATEPTATHTYAEPGTYEATVTVDDGTLCEPVPAYLPQLEVFPFTGQTAYCSGPSRVTSEPVEIEVQELPRLGLSVSLRRPQSSLRSVRVTATCKKLECDARVFGRIAVRAPGSKPKRFKLERDQRKLSPDAPTALAPRIPAKARLAARKALAAGGRVRARVRVRATGLGGQQRVALRRLRIVG